MEVKVEEIFPTEEKIARPGFEPRTLAMRANALSYSQGPRPDSWHRYFELCWESLFKFGLHRQRISKVEIHVCIINKSREKILPHAILLLNCRREVNEVPFHWLILFIINDNLLLMIYY